MRQHRRALRSAIRSRTWFAHRDRGFIPSKALLNYLALPRPVHSRRPRPARSHEMVAALTLPTPTPALRPGSTRRSRRAGTPRTSSGCSTWHHGQAARPSDTHGYHTCWMRRHSAAAAERCRPASWFGDAGAKFFQRRSCDRSRCRGQFEPALPDGAVLRRALAALTKCDGLDGNSPRRLLKDALDRRFALKPRKVQRSSGGRHRHDRQPAVA